MTTDVITCPFETRKGFVSPLRALTTRDSVLGYRFILYIDTAWQLIVFWDASFFFVNNDDFHDVDGFKKSPFCTWKYSSVLFLFPSTTFL